MSRTYGAILCSLDQAPFCTPLEWHLWEGWTKWPPVSRVSGQRTALLSLHQGPGLLPQRMRLLAPVRAYISSSGHQNTHLGALTHEGHRGEHWPIKDIWEQGGKMADVCCQAFFWTFLLLKCSAVSAWGLEWVYGPSFTKQTQRLSRRAESHTYLKIQKETNNPAYVCWLCEPTPLC